ncbi:MAG: hypothetical protein L0K01_00265 [Brachybacterium sp.]|nr:hypothetical protein [Brachybacterium sp.]
MTTLATLALSDEGTVLDVARSFLVTRQDRSSRSYSRLGVLSALREGWAFRYFREVERDPATPRLPGFPDASIVAESPFLFPLFAQRVISSRRPDRAEVLDSLGLDEAATTFEILARNGGRRQGDTIELIQLPTPHPDGGDVLEFLAHGVRYRSVEEQRAIDGLSAGDELQIVPAPCNQADPEARRGSTKEGTGVGWVPGPLLPLLERAGSVSAGVAHANPSGTNPHLRLLVRLRGELISAAHFDDSRWDLVA